MKMKKWLKTPKGYVTIAMIVLLLIASIGSKEILGIKNAFVAVIRFTHRRYYLSFH